VSLGLERLAQHIGEVGQRIAAGHVERLQELRGLLYQSFDMRAELIVDGSNLVRVVHGISWLGGLVRKGETKSPAARTTSAAGPSRSLLRAVAALSLTQLVRLSARPSAVPLAVPP
jgi:hypothetical protein